MNLEQLLQDLSTAILIGAIASVSLQAIKDNLAKNGKTIANGIPMLIVSVLYTCLWVIFLGFAYTNMEIKQMIILCFLANVGAQSIYGLLTSKKPETTITEEKESEGK